MSNHLNLPYFSLSLSDPALPEPIVDSSRSSACFHATRKYSLAHAVLLHLLPCVVPVASIGFQVIFSKFTFPGIHLSIWFADTLVSGATTSRPFALCTDSISDVRAGSCLSSNTTTSPLPRSILLPSNGVCCCSSLAAFLNKICMFINSFAVFHCRHHSHKLQASRPFHCTLVCPLIIFTGFHLSMQQ